MKTTRKELVSQRLKEARSSVGETQKQVGESVNVSRGTICGYETGKRLPSIEMICDLAKHYNTEVGYLLGMDTEVQGSAQTELKHLIKGRFLDISDLPDAAKKELMRYHRYLKMYESEKNL